MFGISFALQVTSFSVAFFWRNPQLTLNDRTRSNLEGERVFFFHVFVFASNL